MDRESCRDSRRTTWDASNCFRVCRKYIIARTPFLLDKKIAYTAQNGRRLKTVSYYIRLRFIFQSLFLLLNMP